jgi:hypothetical protein
MSQKSKILKLMREQGFVTRNWALQNFISRLGAIICTLKKEGMNITAEWKDGDYVYKLLDKPKEIIEYRVDGLLVHKKVIY